MRRNEKLYTSSLLGAAGSPSPPLPPAASQKLDARSTLVSKECACGVCDNDPSNDYDIFDDKGRECCKCEEKKYVCFPAAARVSLENGKMVRMSELAIGDRVQTGRLWDSSPKYSEVRVFLDQKPTVTTMYKSITTSNNNTIYLSNNHLIYSRKSSVERFISLYADDVSVGDEVLAINENDELTPAQVNNISSFNMQGAYAPLTMEGSIVVDGVLASCYAYAHHDLVHFAMTPIRWFPIILEWIFGDENGIPGYAWIVNEIGMWVIPMELVIGNQPSEMSSGGK